MPATDLLALHAASTPDKPAVVEGASTLSYDELDRLANRCAAVLRAHGVGAGDTIVWCGPNSTEVVAIVNAARKAGAVAVPLNHRLTAEEATYVIEDSAAVVVLFDVEQAEQLRSGPAACPDVEAWLAFRAGATHEPVPDWAVDLDAEVAAAPDENVTPSGAAGGAGATMIYTSGTTGKPKGAVRRAGTDVAVAMGLIGLVGFRADDVYLTTGPLYHSGPLAFMAIAQALGGTTVVQRHFEAETWLALVDRHRVTTTFAAPTPIRRVLDLPAEVRARYDYSSMERMVGNAAPWPFDLKRRYVEAFGNGSLWEVYGSTELGVNTVLAPADQLRKPGSCGRPAPMVEIALFDDDGNLVEATGQPGELFVRSNGAFDTYHNAQEAYDDVRRGEWLTVGDVAYRDEEGYYFICDRKKDMVVSGGMNVYPAEVEAVLVAHPAVADAAVFGVPSDEWGESVHATVSLYPGTAATDDELRSFCRDHLAPYKVPRSFDRMDELPRTASGKLLKRQLREPWWEGRQTRVG